jgi:DNA-binding LacI/PurR family transcriptional regulator/biotin operon repressor
MGTDTDTITAPPVTRATRGLRKWLIEAGLQTGDPLPSERILAQRLGVARNTIRAALERFEAAGVIESRGGRCRRVIKRSPATQSVIGAEALAVLSSNSIPGGRRAPGWSIMVRVAFEAAVHSAGRHVLALQPQAEDLDTAIARLLALRPGGLALFGGAIDDGSLETLGRGALAAGLPCEVLDRPALLDTADHVDYDHETGQRLATAALIERGCSRVLRLWHLPRRIRERPAWLARRDEGYLQAMAAAGLDAETPIEFVMSAPKDDDPARAFELERRVVAGHLAQVLLAAGPGPLGIVCTTDGHVPVAASACRLLGREPGRDILIAGYDHYWAEGGQRCFEPYRPAVTIDKRNDRAGAALAGLLEDRLAGRLGPAPVRHLVTPELVEDLP